MLERLLREAKTRKSIKENIVEDTPIEDAANVPKFTVGTFNAISQKGLSKFDPAKYRTIAMTSEAARNEEIHVSFFIIVSCVISSDYSIGYNAS